ncbi:MAG: hypothetical protein KDA84_07665, partial [Planctomycetaceae bacterium]|nr:hypothetical protein [Planctomycetaceae bacterium]
LVNGGVGFAFGFVMAGSGIVGRGDELKLQLMSLPISFLVMSALLSAMLPTTFVRAVLVSICQFVISLLIVGVIALVVVAVTAAI